MEYPEHEKMMKIKDISQAIGEFLEFSGYSLCEWDDDYEEYFPARKSVNEILAAYFGIDLNEIEKEKRMMLEEIRKLNG